MQPTPVRSKNISGPMLLYQLFGLTRAGVISFYFRDSSQFFSRLDRMQLKAGKCPSEALSLTNRVAINANDHAQLQQAKHVVVNFAGKAYPFTVEPDPSMTSGQVGHGLMVLKLGTKKPEKKY